MTESGKIRLKAAATALILIGGAPLWWFLGIGHQTIWRKRTFKEAIGIMSATYLDAYKDLRVEIQFGVKAEGDYE